MAGGKGNITPSDGKPFVKGDSRINRKGRAPKLPELEKLLAEVLGEKKDRVSAVETILKALRHKATKGDIRAAELLLDRAYGKLKNSTDLSLDIEKLTESQLDSIINKLLNKAT